MKRLLTTSALVLALATGGASLAYAERGEGFEAHKKAMEETIAKLPADKQALVKKSFEEGRADHKTQREQMKTLHEQRKAILTAPTFDKAAFIAKSKEIAAAEQAMHAKRTDRLANLAAQLNQEERKVLAELAPKHGKFGRHGKRD